MSNYSEYEYRKQPGFDMNTFEGAYQAIPMKTLVIHCFDPRAAEIPQAVAAYFGRVKTFSTKMAIELDPREHCLSRPMRVDAPPSL
jgi:hypothetical protein